MISGVEKILFHSDLFVHIFSYLCWSKVVFLEKLNKIFLSSIRSSEPLWREISRLEFQTKVYIPDLFRRLTCPGNKICERVDLSRLSIRQLKGQAAKYGLNITTCFEKTDIINVINNRELRHKLPDESLARFGLRGAIVDSTRNRITVEELCEIEWQIRVRSGGPLESLVADDPWWQGGASTTRGKFDTAGNLVFSFVGPSPFEQMLVANQHDVSYTLDYSATFVLLSFGVREYIGRHPDNWGFIMMSNGSLWCGFEMPKRGTDNFLEDDLVQDLVWERPNDGFRI
jgi:hypothetical protein